MHLLNIELRDDEMNAIKKMAARLDLTIPQTIRQAIRLYQSHHELIFNPELGVELQKKSVVEPHNED